MLPFALGHLPVYAQGSKSAPTPAEAQQAVQERLEATRVPGERELSQTIQIIEYR
jgi:hypothetical protein